MSDAKDKIPLVCPGVYHSIIADPQFKQTGKWTRECFSTAPLGLQGAFDGGKDAQRLFWI